MRSLIVAEALVGMSDWSRSFVCGSIGKRASDNDSGVPCVMPSRGSQSSGSDECRSVDGDETDRSPKPQTRLPVAVSM